MTTATEPSASFLTLSAARSGLTAPLVCAGCGSEQSLKTVVGNWIINPVTAALAVACAIVFPVMIIYGRVIHVLLYRGDVGWNGAAAPSAVLLLIPLVLGSIVFSMAAHRFQMTHSLCGGCIASLRAPLRLLTPAGIWFAGATGLFGVFAGAATIVVNDDPISIPAGLVMLAVGALLLWLCWKWWRWFLGSRPVFVEGDEFAVRLHAKSSAFVARLQGALSEGQAVTDAAGPAASSTDAPPTYVPLAGLSTVVTALLVTGIAADLAGIVSTCLQISMLLQRTVDVIPGSVMAANDQREKVVAIVRLVIFAAGGIAFLVWLHRARRNLESDGVRGLACSPGFAVGCWFIPLTNLYLPFRIMLESWKVSGAPRGTGEAWRLVPSTPLLRSWWLLFLLAQLLGLLTISLFRDVDVLADSANSLTYGLLVASWVQLATDLAAVLSALLLIVIVRAIGRRLDRSR
jgi:hypothetical protein